MRQGFFLDKWPIETAALSSREYPEALRRIEQWPEKLYYRGNILLLQNHKCFAIVGTRRCSDYGREIAYWFARELAGAGLVIISGMARGIDSFAHKGALETNGKTIAVLGTGLDEKTIYPQENLPLAKEILEKGGLVLSEYPNEYPGSQYTFPQRNRVISALSLGVLIVEAKYKSGALITAGWAKKQNKPIFAIPGSIKALNCKGPHLLIKKGAVLVERPSEILKHFSIQAAPLLQSQAKGAAQNSAETKIIEALSQGALHIDKIIAKINLPAQDVSAAVSILEISNQLKNLGGNVYSLI